MASHNTNKFKSNTIVMYRVTRQPVYIFARNNSNEAPHTWQYSVMGLGWLGFQYKPEGALRPMTFREFASFTHPLTGGWMVGKTRGWMAWVIHLFSLLGIELGIIEAAYGNFAALSVTGISLGVLVLFWVYTYRNFKGTTV